MDFQNYLSKCCLSALLIGILLGFGQMSCKKDIVISKTEELPETVDKTPKKFEIDLANLIWADEFDKDGLPDAKKWGYDLGGNGWGNQELQNYTQELENAEVKNGLLRITALKKTLNYNLYTSARLVSKQKGDFLYGRVEVKARLPKGVGTWPAIWMLPTEQVYGGQYWPDNGEIDIMEHVGFDQNIVHGNIHTKAFNHAIGTNKGNKVEVSNASESFNVYAINWLPDKIVFEINGKEYFTFTNYGNGRWEEWPFDKRFHVILNIAVGGAWGGQKGVDETVFPQTMEVDYVKVFGIKEVK
jgi:beta-glucanase (GH16 family)